MKRNIKIMFIYVLIAFFLCLPNVHANTEITSRTIIEIDGKEVHKFYDNTVTGAKNYVGGRAGKVEVTIDGKIYPGFCIDFGMSVSTGTVENPQTLYNYFRNVLSDSEAKSLVKKLTLYTKFGYGHEGKNTDKYYLATQQLIWQAISDSGFYNSDFYHEQTEKKVSKIKLENFRWTNDDGATTIDISSEIKSIENDIKNYYKTPSFCSSTNKLEIEVGETAEFIDNNNVLSQYNVNCDEGLTCETIENKLKVTATKEAGSRKIIFKKYSSGTENYVYRVASKQGIIVEEGILESISCSFEIDTFKNEKTADIQIVHIIIIGIFCGTMAYITYYTKKSFDKIS